MDTEKSGETLAASETPQSEEAVMEKEAVSKLETPEESTEPEKPPAAEDETEHVVVNGHPTQIINLKGTEELLVATPPEPDASSEKLSELVEALHIETENAEQPSVPESDPESLPTLVPLTESDTDPEPEKSAETVPEAEPVVLQQPGDTQPPSQEKVVSEQVETATGPEATMDVGVESGDAVKPKEAQSSEKPAEAALSKEKASAEVENVKPAEDEKEVKPDAELQKEEATVPASGSLSIAMLEREQTKNALIVSRTLVVLRGLPGSGKSFLARAIADVYKDHCSIICADDHGIKPEKPESCADGYKALDEAVVACCKEGTTTSVLIVVDDTNHTQDRLARLGEIAEQQHLTAVFFEPLTEWNRDVAHLTKKTKRGLEAPQLEAMKVQLEEVSLPLYYGWFLLPPIQDKVKCTIMDFVKTLDTLEAFKKHLTDFTGKTEEVDLEHYFQDKGTLHCTTKFCNYGQAEGAKEYAENPAICSAYGDVFELSLSALFVTPRTVGARVSLTEEQLLLWPADAEKQAESVGPAAASLPLGSRAHVTLGCAEGVEPVQTGLDLLEILALQQEGQQGELVEEMELGSLTYYGEGRWLLSLREPIGAQACFSSYYGRKETELAKEKEKKKKPKCTIL